MVRAGGWAGLPAHDEGIRPVRGQLEVLDHALIALVRPLQVAFRQNLPIRVDQHDVRQKIAASDEHPGADRGTVEAVKVPAFIRLYGVKRAADRLPCREY